MKRRRLARAITLTLALAIAYGLLAIAQLDASFNGVDVVAWVVFAFVIYRVASLPPTIGGHR